MSTDSLASGWAKAIGVDRKQFDMFFDKMLDGFAYHKIVVDKSGKPVDYVFLEVNHAFEKMTGLKREHIIGKKATEALPGLEKDPAGWIDVYGKVALTGEPIQFENYATPLCKWYKVIAYCPEKGYFVALFEDITKRKKAEEALRESEARFHSILDSMIEGGQIIDLDWRYIYINKAAEIQNRRLNKELLGNRYMDMWPGVESTELFVKLKCCMEERIPQEMENCFIFPDKTSGWYDLKITPVPEGIFILSLDITERKKAEDALKKLNDELEERVEQRTTQAIMERQRLYNVLETLPSYVILLDSDYRVKFANKVFRETFGEDRGRRCHEYLFNKDHECEGCITYNVYKENKPQHWYWTGPNGHYYDIYDFPFREVDGSTLILEMGIDITERKKAEAEALESAKKLKDAERLAAIGATAGMVGHDIRNPLQAITGDLFLAKAELSGLPENEVKANALENLAEIEKNIDYINKIVADLQDYARPLNPRAQETSIRSVFTEILSKTSVPENIKVSVQIEKKAEKIKADPDFVKRIAANLTLNAIQAMPDGGELTIRAYVDKQKSDVLITVKDTGVGIPEDIKPRLFAPMMTTKSKGQGFGLAVVKRMTEGLGGTVTFESQEGKGTTFIVRLPPNEINGKSVYK